MTLIDLLASDLEDDHALGIAEGHDFIKPRRKTHGLRNEVVVDSEQVENMPPEEGKPETFLHKPAFRKVPCCLGIAA
jgi:hypothetical protein